MLDRDAESAKTLVLVAIILQIIFFAIGVFVILFATIAAFSFNTVSGTGVTTTSTFNVAGLFAAIFGVIFAIGIIWILLDYFLIYKPIAEERVDRAETPALVLAIIQLIFGGIITGILLLVAWIKIKDSVRYGKKDTGTS